MCEDKKVIKPKKTKVGKGKKGKTKQGKGKKIKITSVS